MRKQYQTSKKARSYTGWWKHLRKYGKRVANKSSRSLSKLKLKRDELAAMIN